MRLILPNHKDDAYFFQRNARGVQCHPYLVFSFGRVAPGLEFQDFVSSRNIRKDLSDEEVLEIASKLSEDLEPELYLPLPEAVDYVMAAKSWCASEAH